MEKAIERTYYFAGTSEVFPVPLNVDKILGRCEAPSVRPPFDTVESHTLCTDCLITCRRTGGLDMSRDMHTPTTLALPPFTIHEISTQTLSKRTLSKYSDRTR